MRELNSHLGSGLNCALKIIASDRVGAGGACLVYRITGCVSDDDGAVDVTLAFQDGPIAMRGINGISNEALLAIVEDRLAGFQMGPFSCEENGVALWHIQRAIGTLHARTEDRAARGVEGALVK